MFDYSVQPCNWEFLKAVPKAEVPVWAASSPGEGALQSPSTSSAAHIKAVVRNINWQCSKAAGENLEFWVHYIGNSQKESFNILPLLKESKTKPHSCPWWCFKGFFLCFHEVIEIIMLMTFNSKMELTWLSKKGQLCHLHRWGNLFAFIPDRWICILCLNKPVSSLHCALTDL